MVNPAVTHSLGVSGVGATTAGTPVTVGTVTFPRPGPWNVWGMWYNIAPDTPTTAEENISFLELVDVNGDLPMNPTPYLLPILSRSAIAGDGQLSEVYPWQWRRFGWGAVPGGSQLRFREDVATSNTVGNQIAAGFFFGVKPNSYDVETGKVLMNHVQRVEGTADSTAETSAGTITLSEKAKMITGLCFTVDQATSAEGEGVLGTYRIDSDDIDLTPSVYPFSHVTSSPLDPAEAILMTSQYEPKFMPVHIPVSGGVAIEFLSTLTVDVGAAAITNAYIGYV